MPYIKERKDSLAIATLSKIETIAPNSPLIAKAKILQEVLKNRDSIEAHLKAMKVTRMKDEEDVARFMGYKTTEKNRMIGYKQIKNLRTKNQTKSI